MADSDDNRLEIRISEIRNDLTAVGGKLDRLDDRIAKIEDEYRRKDGIRDAVHSINNLKPTLDLIDQHERRLSKLDQLRQIDKQREVNRKLLDSKANQVRAEHAARDRKIFGLVMAIFLAVFWGWDSVVAWGERFRSWVVFLLSKGG